MKDFFILLAVACFCHIASSQNEEEDPYSGLGYLKPLVMERILRCSNTWMQGCTSPLTAKPTGLCQCAPYLELSSKPEDTAGPGGNITLFCLFFGFPTPLISWRGPHDSLPSGRHVLTNLNTTLILNGITASDEGNYSCTASNFYGQRIHTLQFLVVAAPEFKNKSDGPFNVTVTEGKSVTFNCNPFAIPEANIVWLQNGQPIDTDNPLERFAFSNDSRSLTIRDVCRDCVDRKSKTDLMVIQCNASNAHGYVFASGYLNVLRADSQKKGAWAAWKIILVAGAIGFGFGRNSDA